MNICYGPIEYLKGFALVLAAGALAGFGLGWHFCSLVRQYARRAPH